MANESVSKVWKRVALAGLLVGFFSLAYYLRATLTPFIISMVIAYILDPLIDRFEKFHIPRVFGILIVISLLAILVTLFFIAIVPVVRIQLEVLAQKMPDYIATLKEWILPLAQRLYHENKDQARAILDQTLGNLSGLPLKAAEIVSTMIWSSLSKLGNLFMLLINIFIIPFATFYLLKDSHRIHQTCVDLIPPSRKETWLGLLREIDFVLSGFIRGQLTVCLILTCVYSIGLMITQTPLALLIALVAGFANLIPYLGLLIGLLPALALSALQFGDWQHPLGVLATFLIAQILDGTLISPRIVGTRVGLHPVLVILAVFVAGSLFGFFGILIAVPATAVIKVSVKWLMNKYLKPSNIDQS